MAGSSLFLPLAVLAVYLGVSKVVFDNVYVSSKIVIDEMFHLPQGLQYCNLNFTHWNPKITTLPGLYIISTLLVRPFFECDSYNLRLISLVASGVNFLLILSILRERENKSKQNTKLIHVLQAINLTILPPLYFFSHVYYTDVLSITFLLLLFKVSKTTNHFGLVCVCLLCLLMRQTNIVWIGFTLAERVLKIFLRSYSSYSLSKRKTSKNNKEVKSKSLMDRKQVNSNLRANVNAKSYGIVDFYNAAKFHLSTGLMVFFKSISYTEWLFILSNVLIMLIFIIFIFLNGSIVVGDKNAHVASLHVPQLFYFLLFYGAFGLPFVLRRLNSTILLCWQHKTSVVALSFLALLAVHHNTLVHPYLLADNRHYTFYIWNRWFGRYDLARYITVPPYSFLLISLYDNLRLNTCISFTLPFLVCAFAAMALQKMIEVRYFLIPYLILRLRFETPSWIVAASECLLYVLVNAATLNLFFTKEITWADFDDVQRIIW